MKVPFLDLKAQYETIKDEIAQSLQDVLERTAFASGPFVEQFEQSFAEYCQCKYAVGVNSGTTALWMALLGAGVEPGDEVITVPDTFIATAEAISFCGATPVFVDVDEITYNMNPDLLEAAITPKTKAIVPVHLYGQMADMDPIRQVADAHNIPVIEDSAQAHAAEYKGSPPGKRSLAACFSFYAGKNLGAYGEAGAMVTNDESLAAAVREMRDHGQEKKYYHKRIGWNGRMDGFQGAVLSVKLPHLLKWTDLRRKHAAQYSELLTDVEDIRLPVEMDYAKHVYHLYVVRVPRRDQLIASLAKKEIFCGIHYPVPVHLQEAYRFLGLKKGAFPVSEKCAEEIVSLPMFPELSEDQITRVCDEIQTFYRAGVKL